MSMSFTLGLIPQVICISCTLNFVQEVYFHTCWCFIIDILKEDVLKLFLVVGLRLGQKTT